jgi:hypothetical protein
MVIGFEVQSFRGGLGLTSLRGNSSRLTTGIIRSLVSALGTSVRMAAEFDSD